MFGTKQSRTEAAAQKARSAGSDLGAAASERLDELKARAADQSADAAAVARARYEDARDTAAARAREGYDSFRDAAAPRLHDAADQARDRYAAAREAAAPAMHDAAEVARDRLVVARSAATDAAHEAADRMAPKVEAASASLRGTVLPRVGAAVANAASAVAAGAEQVKDAAAPHVEQAAKSAHLSGDRAKGAYSVLKGDSVAKPQGGKLKWLLGIGLIAATVAAVSAWRRQQQADDPWATPLNDGRNTAFGGPSGSPSPLADTASEKLDQAQDTMGGLGGMGDSDVTGAPDRAGEKMDDATNNTEDLINDAKAKAEQSRANSSDAENGQVTSMPAKPGTDAGEGDAAPRRVGGEFENEEPSGNH